MIKSIWALGGYNIYGQYKENKRRTLGAFKRTWGIHFFTQSCP